MINIFLDDFRFPIDAFNYTSESLYLKEEWVVVRNYVEFKQKVIDIGIENVGIISWDHDLGIEHYNDEEAMVTGIINYDKYTEKTGYHCVKWLCDYCLDNNAKLPTCIFHTQNNIGYENMSIYVRNYRKYCE